MTVYLVSIINHELHFVYKHELATLLPSKVHYRKNSKLHRLQNFLQSLILYNSIQKHLFRFKMSSNNFLFNKYNSISTNLHIIEDLDIKII